MGNEQSEKLFADALRWIPGGVNSPVRAFGAVGGTPLFLARGKGARVEDTDGNSYIDLVASWGPLILGHADAKVRAAIVDATADGWTFGAPTQSEVELARMICECVPSIESVRMVNSGTEATLSAVRLARGFTGREKILKFIGCYHGHHDALLVAAGSGLATMGVPSSPGVTAGTTGDTLLCPYNDVDAVRAVFAEHGKDIACVIVEPIAGNMGLVPASHEFLTALREASTAAGALLIFDEVISGFRVGLGGAQALTGITPDLTTLGKIIGGGLPVGAYGGRADVMAAIAPAGEVYQAGTLSGNPLAMASGIATVKALSEQGVYESLERRGAMLEETLRPLIEKQRGSICFHRVGSMFTLFFTAGPVRNFEDAAACDTKRYARYFHAMLAHGAYPPPSQFETNFLSLAHTDDDVHAVAGAISQSVEEALAA